MHMKSLYFIYSFHLIPTIFPTTQLTTEIFNSPKNFKEDKEKAKKWGEKNYEKWQTKLSAREIEELTNYAGRDYREINQYLRQTRGELAKNNDKLSTWSNENVNEMNEKIKIIDQALAKVKITETISVFRRVNENQFNMPLEQLRNDDETINQVRFKTIKRNFINKKFTQYGFMSTSLIQNPKNTGFEDQRFPILLKITAPKGTYGAYLGNISRFQEECEMIISRGYNFKYKSFSIVHEGNREMLKVNVSLVRD